MTLGMKNKVTEICVEISDLNLAQAIFVQAVVMPSVAKIIETYEDEIIDLGKENLTWVN